MSSLLCLLPGRSLFPHLLTEDSAGHTCEGARPPGSSLLTLPTFVHSVGMSHPYPETNGEDPFWCPLPFNSGRVGVTPCTLSLTPLLLPFAVLVPLEQRKDAAATFVGPTDSCWSFGSIVGTGGISAPFSLTGTICGWYFRLLLFLNGIASSSVLS